VEEAVPPLQETPIRKPTILIVEDQFITRWVAAEYLRDQGYKIIEAVDATEAMGLAGSGIVIDVVFSDVELGSGQSGHELAHWFAKHRPSTAVLLTSGSDHGDTLPASKLRRFVRKPYDLGQVERLLRSMMEKS
jgi:DNA-binding NtrC family response regulator